MARKASRPKHVTVRYRGMPYTLDLVVCQRALIARQVDGELDSMESLAVKAGISRSTASRFFSGRPTSLAVTLRILHVLRVKFDDVAKPAHDEVHEGSPGAGQVSGPALHRPDGGIGRSMPRVV